MLDPIAYVDAFLDYLCEVQQGMDEDRDGILIPVAGYDHDNIHVAQYLIINPAF
jgi:hypothetical protein